MRLILLMLAVVNLRWGSAAIERSHRLGRDADAALDEAERHYATAQALADRLGLPAR